MIDEQKNSELVSFQKGGHVELMSVQSAPRECSLRASMVSPSDSHAEGGLNR